MHARADKYHASVQARLAMADWEGKGGEEKSAGIPEAVFVVGGGVRMCVCCCAVLWLVLISTSPRAGRCGGLHAVTRKQLR